MNFSLFIFFTTSSIVSTSSFDSKNAEGATISLMERLSITEFQENVYPRSIEGLARSGCYHVDHARLVSESKYHEFIHELKTSIPSGLEIRSMAFSIITEALEHDIDNNVLIPLLEAFGKGAVNITNNAGSTPLFFVKTVLQAHILVYYGCDVNASNISGNKAADEHFFNGRYEIAEFLKKLNSDYQRNTIYTLEEVFNYGL